MDTKLIFCDETEQFRHPADPGPGEAFSLKVWVPAGEDCPVSFIFSCDEKTLEIPARFLGNRGLVDEYGAKHPGSDKRLLYYLRFRFGEEEHFYGRNGLQSREAIIPFSVNPDYNVPEWARGALWYQIYPDRFCNGDPANDVQDGEIRDDVGFVSRRMGWQEPVAPMEIHHYYGGDLAGIIQKLDYLQNLGVEVLYLNPIFTAPSNHKYNTVDYEHVDPHLGPVSASLEPLSNCWSKMDSEADLSPSDAMLAELIRQAHERNIRVVLDGVFNHVSSQHPWNQGGPNSERYNDYFRRNPQGEIECWWGNHNLLKLNVDGSPSLKEYLLSIAEKWITAPFHADGWRLDVAADLGHSPEANHAFWQDFRRRVRKANPQAMILAEHYGDPSPWLQGDQWDSVMNYDAFMDPVSGFFTGLEKHGDEYCPWLEGAGDEFSRIMQNTMARFPRPALETALNQLDNHDHSRFLTRTNHLVGRLGELTPEDAETNVDPSLLRAAALLQMCWPGAPGLYYGDEAGLCGFTDPDNRRTFPWGREDGSLLDYYQGIIRLRKRHSALKRGSLRILRGEPGLLVFGRFDQKERLLVIINQSLEEKELCLDIRSLDGLGAAKLRRLIQCDKDSYNMGWLDTIAEEDTLQLCLQPRECSVWALLS